MHEFTWYDASRLVNQRLLRPFTQIAQALHLVPIIAGIATLGLFGFIGQLGEIYIGLAEQKQGPGLWLHLALAFFSFTLLSGAIYFSNYTLTSVAIDALYRELGNPNTDRRLRLFRNWSGMISAGLPWFGLAIGLWRTASSARTNATAVTATAQAMGDGSQAISVRDSLIAAATRLDWAAWLALAAGIAVVALIHRGRRERLVRQVVLGLIVATVLLLLVLPVGLSWLGGLFGGDSQTSHYPVETLRQVGPLAMIAIAAAALYSVIAMLALLSSQIGFPLIALTLVLGIAMLLFNGPVQYFAVFASGLFVLLAGVGIAARRVPLTLLSLVMAAQAGALAWQLGAFARPVDVSKTTETATPHHADAGDRFQAWLEARRGARRAFGDRPYPVIVVAVQGGGIYAAAAAEAFLSALQRRCPAFAHHVFALSSVSGGSLGAALFQTTVDAAATTPTRCSLPPVPADPGRPSLRPVLDDHLSPLVGFLVADIFGAHDDRARALAMSFTRSEPRLLARFEDHWTPSGARPALVLNSTWVETGFRVAWAPFSLEKSGDGTLRSARDIGLPDVAIADAVTVSARFPGTVPAYQFRQRLWHFVDGGYADSSGATTALELRNRLARTVADLKRSDPSLNVDVRLILLTDTEALKTDATNPQGNPARDTLAPFIALMKVRDLLARQAVQRALARGAMARLDADPSGSGVSVIELEAERFKLPLGWKLSKTTHGLISLLMAPPHICPTPRPTGEAYDKLEAIVRNACAIDDIAALLTPPG